MIKDHWFGFAFGDKGLRIWYKWLRIKDFWTYRSAIKNLWYKIGDIRYGIYILWSNTGDTGLKRDSMIQTRKHVFQKALWSPKDRYYSFSTMNRTVAYAW